MHLLAQTHRRNPSINLSIRVSSIHLSKVSSKPQFLAKNMKKYQTYSLLQSSTSSYVSFPPVLHLCAFWPSGGHHRRRCSHGLPLLKAAQPHLEGVQLGESGFPFHPHGQPEIRNKFSKNANIANIANIL